LSGPTSALERGDEEFLLNRRLSWYCLSPSASSSLRLLDHLVGMDAADGGTGVGGSVIGRRGKGLALAILVIPGGAETAPKGEVIGPALFAFFSTCLPR
jgi:hypothetical protein